jgi:beta-galactosidase
LLSYMSGQSFEPGVEVSAGVLEAVLFDTRIMARLGATVSGEGPNAGAAMDGDPNTYWIAGGSGRGMTGTKHPHALTITFPSAVAMDGVVLMPRQNDRDHVGDIRQFKLEASDDGERWRELASGELVSTWSPQRVMLPSRTEAKHLRFTALSGFGNDTSAALAELAVLHFESKPEGQDAENFEYRRSRSTSTDVDEGGEAPSSGTNAVPRNP